MTAKKKAPPLAQAMFLDNPEGGGLEINLLYARIETLKKDGEAAMSPMDLRNGFSPESIVRMMTRQLVQFLKGRQATLEPGEQWIDRLGSARQPYLLRDEIAHLEKQLETMDNTMTEATEAITPGTTKTTGIKEPPGGALSRLYKASEIRRSIFLIRAQLKEIRKDAKEKITILEKAQAGLLDDVDDKQMTLFDVDSVSPDAQVILDNPSL